MLAIPLARSRLTVRPLKTLDLLLRLSPELPQLQLSRLVSALPHKAAKSHREREQAVSKAFEVIEALRSLDQDDGTSVAERVAEVLLAAEPGVSDPSGKGKGKERAALADEQAPVLESAIADVLVWVQNGQLSSMWT